MGQLPTAAAARLGDVVGTKMPDAEEDATTLEELEARIASLEREHDLDLGGGDAAAEAEAEEAEEGYTRRRKALKAKLNEAFLASSGHAPPGMLLGEASAAASVSTAGGSTGSYEKLQRLVARADALQQECRAFDPDASAASFTAAAPAAPDAAPPAPVAAKAPWGFAASASWASSSGAAAAPPLFSASEHAAHLDELEARLQAISSLIHEESLRVPIFPPQGGTMRV